jgi:hypothetical protein
VTSQWVNSYTLEKLCARCQRSLPLSSFRSNAKLSSGLDSWCRECRNEAAREWRERHRDEYNARRRIPPARLLCVECGAVFAGRKGRLV